VITARENKVQRPTVGPHKKEGSEKRVDCLKRGACLRKFCKKGGEKDTKANTRNWGFGEIGEDERNPKVNAVKTRCIHGECVARKGGSRWVSYMSRRRGLLTGICLRPAGGERAVKWD